MINITAQTPNLAWVQCMKHLLLEAKETDNDKYYRDELFVIEILAPCIEEVPTEFPMAQAEIDIINRYIITGENESAVSHEWTKLYYRRIYAQPNSQYEYFLDKLGQKNQSGRAQISLWDKMRDQTAEITPCTQIIWGRIKFARLEMHVHAHSVDAYKKLLMNQQEFISLQMEIARKLNVGIGKFYHLIDSCHIYNSDVDKILELNLFDSVGNK